MTEADKLELGQGNPLFTTQFRALSEGIAGNGVLAAGDLAVSADSNTALGLLVAPGTLRYDGADHALNAQATLSLSAGDGTNDRWDTAVYDAGAGGPAVIEGTAEQYPTPPDVGAGQALLAVVYVPSGASDVPDANVLNWRATHQGASAVRVADAPENFTSDNVEGALAEAANSGSGGGGDGPRSVSLVSSDTTTNGEGLIGADTSNGGFVEITLASSDATDGNTITVFDYGDSIVSGSEIYITTEGDATVDGSSRAIIRDPGGAFHLSYLQSQNDWQVLNQFPDPGGSPAKQSIQYTSASSVTVGDEAIFASTASSAQTVTIPSSEAVLGRRIIIVDGIGNASSNPMTIETGGSSSIAGSSTFTVDNNYGGVMLAFTPGQWNIVSEWPASDSDDSGFSAEDTGQIAAGDAGAVYTTSLADGETLSVRAATLTLADGRPAPTGLDLVIATLDNSGNGTVQTTVLSGDGATVHDRVAGSPVASYTNSSGGEQTIAIVVDNGHFGSASGGAGRSQNATAAVSIQR